MQPQCQTLLLGAKPVAKGIGEPLTFLGSAAQEPRTCTNQVALPATQTPQTWHHWKSFLIAKCTHRLAVPWHLSRGDRSSQQERGIRAAKRHHHKIQVPHHRYILHYICKSKCCTFSPFYRQVTEAYVGTQILHVSEGFGHSKHTNFLHNPTVISVTCLGAGKEPVAVQGINLEQPQVQLLNWPLLFSHITQKWRLREELHYEINCVWTYFKLACAGQT